MDATQPSHPEYGMLTLRIPVAFIRTKCFTTISSTIGRNARSSATSHQLTCRNRSNAMALRVARAKEAADRSDSAMGLIRQTVSVFLAAAQVLGVRSLQRIVQGQTIRSTFGFTSKRIRRSARMF